MCGGIVVVNVSTGSAAREAEWTIANNDRHAEKIKTARSHLVPRRAAPPLKPREQAPIIRSLSRAARRRFLVDLPKRGGRKDVGRRAAAKLAANPAVVGVLKNDVIPGPYTIANPAATNVESPLTP